MVNLYVPNSKSLKTLFEFVLAFCGNSMPYLVQFLGYVSKIAYFNVPTCIWHPVAGLQGAIRIVLKCVLPVSGCFGHITSVDLRDGRHG